MKKSEIISKINSIISKTGTIVLESPIVIEKTGNYITVIFELTSGCIETETHPTFILEGEQVYLPDSAELWTVYYEDMSEDQLNEILTVCENHSVDMEKTWERCQD